MTTQALHNLTHMQYVRDQEDRTLGLEVQLAEENLQVVKAGLRADEKLHQERNEHLAEEVRGRPLRTLRRAPSASPLRVIADAHTVRGLDAHAVRTARS